MINTVDLFLGAFLILCGFALSLFNLRRVLKDKMKFSAVLLSENILLMCIGAAFMIRAIHELYVLNVHIYDMDERVAGSIGQEKYDTTMECGFRSVLMSYGPLIVSLVNSFLSLIIDNYMHYKMIQEINKEEDENTVQEIHEEAMSRRMNLEGLFSFWKKYFSYIVIALQWIVPVLITITMYPMGVSKMEISHSVLRSSSSLCMAMIDYSNSTGICTGNNILDSETNYSLDLGKYYKPPENYLQVYENEEINGNVSTEINSIIKNVFQIVSSLKNDSIASMNVTSRPLAFFRRPKSEELCTKVCYVDNKNLLLYMFALTVVCYFVPITISTVILTKIHVMDVKKPNLKTYVSRELLYNVLFWTPVMLDTFLSLILCTYSTNGMKTSMFNVIANVYQAIKNFMNTKYFKDNTVTPI